MTAIDMVGRTYGRLTVISRAGSTALGQATWVAHCVCGNEIIVSGASMRKGHTRSCGCLHKDTISTHGAYRTRTYKLWGNMKTRCATHPQYAAVSVHPAWANAYEAFLVDMGECPKGMTLDRIDNTKGYEPGNCRWATMRTQVRNRACTKLDADKAAAIRADARGTAIIASEYGVHPVTIRMIKRGELWV